MEKRETGAASEHSKSPVQWLLGPPQNFKTVALSEELQWALQDLQSHLLMAVQAVPS